MPHTRAEKTKIYLGCFGEFGEMDDPQLNQVTEIMNKAARRRQESTGLIPTSPPVAEVEDGFRSRLAQPHPLRAEAREKKLPFLGPKDPFEAAEEFAQLCKRFKTKAAVISQEKNLANYLQGLKAGFLAQKNPPEICRGIPEDAWVVFDALSFNNYHDAATIVDDSEGWNGKSVRMGTKVDWNTNYTPPVRGKYRILASLRCEGSIKEGKLGSGVYDGGQESAQEHDPRRGGVQDRRTFDRKFRWIELGVVDFVPVLLVRPRSQSRPDALHDRVLLIAAE